MSHADDLVLELAQMTGVDPAEIVKKARKRLRQQESESAALDHLRHHPRRYHTWFVDYVTPPDLLPRVGQLQHEMIEFITDPAWKWKLLLVPRQHVKSHATTISCNALDGALNPDMRIMIDHGVRDKSAQMLASIRGKLTDERVTRLFGQLVPGPNAKQHPNSTYKLTLLTRKDLSIKEATFTASGLGVSEASNHYDRIVADDLVCEENSGEQATAETLEGPIRRFESYTDLLDPNGEIWCVGTRWNPLDLWQHILDTFIDPRCKNDSGQFDRHVPRCSCDFNVMHREVVENGHYVYPEVFNDEILQKIQRSKSPYNFSCHYLNNPTDPSNAWFDHSKLDACLYDDESYERDHGRPIGEMYRAATWYMTVDPAESKSRQAAMTGVVQVAIDEHGTWWVDWATGKKVETHEFVNLIISRHRAVFESYGVRPIFGMELNTRKALEYVLKISMEALGWHFNIRELKPVTSQGPDAKERHIKRLQVPLDMGKLRIHRRCGQLLRTFKGLPATRQRDIVDALAYVADMAPPIDIPGDAENDPNPVPEPELLWEECGY